MDSLYDISWKVTEEEYRQDPAYSYSKIARFNKVGFNGLNTLNDKIESPSLLFGSLVDTLMTEPETINDRFFVTDFPELSENLLKISYKLYDMYKLLYTTVSDIPDDILAQVGADMGYYDNVKYKDYRVKLIKENCNQVYQLLLLSEGKKLVDLKTYQTALKTVDVLNEEIDIFKIGSNPFDKSIEGFNQLKFKGEYKGIPIRCMFDRIIVDHNTKTIKPFDLKTSYKKEWDFYISYIEWCYFIQSNLYIEILKQNVEKHPIYKDYKIDNFTFIVINGYNLKPLMWEDTYSQLTCGFSVKDKHYKNWRDLIEELDYYLTENPKYPIGIQNDNPNNIHLWLNN